MPPLRKKAVFPLTIKQERFANLYVLLGNASEAYRQVYDVSSLNEGTVNRNAFALVRHSKVAPRIAELQTKSLAPIQRGITDVVKRLWEEGDYRGKDARHSARVSALAELRKHYMPKDDPLPPGSRKLSIEYTESGPLAEYSVEDLRAILQGIRDGKRNGATHDMEVEGEIVEGNRE